MPSATAAPVRVFMLTSTERWGKRALVKHTRVRSSLRGRLVPMVANSGRSCARRGGLERSDDGRAERGGGSVTALALERSMRWPWSWLSCSTSRESASVRAGRCRRAGRWALPSGRRRSRRTTEAGASVLLDAVEQALATAEQNGNQAQDELLLDDSTIARRFGDAC